MVKTSARVNHAWGIAWRCATNCKALSALGKSGEMVGHGVGDGDGSGDGVEGNQRPTPSYTAAMSG